MNSASMAEKQTYLSGTPVDTLLCLLIIVRGEAFRMFRSDHAYRASKNKLLACLWYAFWF